MSKTSSTNNSVIQPHSSESEQSLSVRPSNVIEPFVAKRICFYKSGDPQFNGIKMVVNSRSFKSFDALLDNLSKRVPLPFGVRNITTPRGVHKINNLEDLKDGKSYICSQQRKIKPINLEVASRKPLPWQISRPISARRRAVQLTRENEGGMFQHGSTIQLSTPKKLLVFRNGNARTRCTVVLDKKNTQHFEAFLDHVSELMQYSVLKLYTTDGRKVSNLQALLLCSGAIVAAGREPFKAGNYDPHRYSLPGRLPGVSSRVYPRANLKSESRKMSGVQIDSSSRSQMFSGSSYKDYSNDDNSFSSSIPDNDMGSVKNCLHTDEDSSVVHSTDDIEKSVHLNQDGSMTVEMRVRFKIKKEETIKWTTTVSHAGTSAVIAEDQVSDLNILTYRNSTEEFSNPEDDVPMQQIRTKMINQNPANQLETSPYDIWQNPDMNTELSQERNNDLKPNFHRSPTPGPRKVSQKKALVESVTVVSDTAVQKKMVGQFSISEEMDNGKTKSKHCMITHASSQISNVTNPQNSRICNNHILNQSQTDQQEKQMLNKDTVKNSSGLPEEDGLLQNVLEKLVVEKRLSNSLTTEDYSSIGQEQSLVKKNNSSGQYLSNKCDTIGQELSSFNNHSEWSQSKSEKMICDQCQVCHCSSSLPPKSNNTIYKYAQVTPTVTESDCITATVLSDESQAISSSSKKKMKKKKNKFSLDIMKQNVGSPKDLYDISIEGTTEKKVNTCTIHNTRDTTKHPPTQLAVHKRGLAFPIGNSEGASKSANTRSDLYSQVSVKLQQNELEANIKKNLNSQLSHQKSKSIKDEDLLLIKDNTKHEFQQIKEGTYKSLNEIEQPPASLKPLTDIGNGQKAEDKKGKSISNKSIKSSSKHKDLKKKKKSETATGSRVKVLDETKMLDTLEHADFTDEITEHALENYIQSWLQNVFPKAVRPPKHLVPLNSVDRKTHHLTVKAFLDKESKETGRNNITEDQPPKDTLNNLSEVQALEESVKELYETHTDCLRNVDSSLKDEAKYLLPSDIQDKAKLSMCDSTHKNNKKLQEETDHARGNSEMNAQVDPTAILGTDVQKDCKSILLHKLKSAIFNFEKNKSGCLKNLNCLSDIFSSPLLGSSSNLLLVWLLLNLKESLPNINKDDMVGASCECSEIFMLLQYLKQVTAKEEDEDLMTAASNTQDCRANCLIFSGMQIEKQELTYCQENISLIATKNIPGTEEQGKLNKNLILDGSVNAEEVLDAKELAEELQSNCEEQKKCSRPAENSDMNELVVMQNLNHIEALSGNVASDEEFLQENEAIPLQELEEKIPDPSLNNKKPDISEESNSTTFNTSVQTEGQIFDLETSQLGNKELNSLEKQKYTESLCKKENSDENLSSAVKNITNENHVENSIKDNLEEVSVETSDQLPIPSPLSFLYESKQIPSNAEDTKSRVKLIVKELERGSNSNASSDLKKIIESSGTSDYQPETDESDCRSRPSSDLSDESTDEVRYEKGYNKGYVKRTIERLYGKAEAAFKPISKPDSTYLAQMLPKDTELPLHIISDEIPLFGQGHNAWPGDKVASSLISYDIHDLNTISNENAILPSPEFSLKGKETFHNEDCSVQNANHHSEFNAQIAEDEGILIDKGKWLLKENHLIRRSPPENTEMYGNMDTTSADTFFDNHSSDAPYSHLDNMEMQSAFKEILSSDLEDMAKACGNEGNHFNMPHNSDSELFPDVPGIKCNNSQNNSVLPFEPVRKEYNTSSELCTELNSYSPAFTVVEFKFPDNRIHPLDQISDDAPVQTQPTRNATSNRNRPEGQDSLDKLHAICGQHCPILTALIKPGNEQIRGCAYQKASDIENQIWLPYLINTPYSIGQDKCIIGLGKPHVQLKISCIHKNSNNIFGQCYTENILDITNCSYFKSPLSLNSLHGVMRVTKGMVAKPEIYKNHESSMRKDALDGPSKSLSSYQSTRSNANLLVGEKRAPLLEHVTASNKSEAYYHQRSFIKMTHWKITVYLKDRNAQSVQLLLIFKQKPSFTKKYFCLLVFLSILTVFSVANANADFSCKKFR